MAQTLTVEMFVDNESESAMVTFSNYQIEFYFNGVPDIDYNNAANACFSGTDWKGDMIEVKDGIVSFRIGSFGKDLGGEMIYKMEARYCAQALKEAYDLLCTVEFP